MAEYIEREALLKKMEKWHTKERLIDCVKDTPAADVVEVVYCKNCKHLMFSDFYGECTKGYMGIVQPNDYCSKGERKEDNE